MFSNNMGAGFNATAGGAQVQNDLAAQAAAAGSGLQASAQALQGTIGSQQQLAQTLAAQASGQGPNPALAQLAQTTQQNVAQQAAMQAGQRGSSQNVGMIARQAGQQGMQAQQQSAGQAATMRAQQILGQQAQLANVYGQISGEQTGLADLYGSQQNMFQNALASQNNALTAQNTNLAAVNQKQAQINTQGQQNMLSQVSGAIGTITGLAKGGEVKQYADGGMSSQQPSLGIDTTFSPAKFGDFSSQVQSNGPKSKIGQYFANPPASSDPNINQQQNYSKFGAGLASGAIKLGKSLFGSDQPDDSSSFDPELDAPFDPELDMVPMAQGGMMQDVAKLAPLLLKKGGKVPAMVSPGERYLPPREVAKVAKGQKAPLKAGEKIKGQAKVKGDSYANDVVPKTLEEGGIVLPRSVTQSKNAPEAARKFVAEILKKKAKGMK